MNEAAAVGRIMFFKMKSTGSIFSLYATSSIIDWIPKNPCGYSGPLKFPETLLFVYTGWIAVSTFGDRYSSTPAMAPEFFRYGPIPLYPRSWIAVSVPSFLTPTL